MKRDGKGYQIYLGRGEAAYAEEAAVAQRKLIREVNRQIGGVMSAITAPVLALTNCSNHLVRATLMASGFREHHREWRRNHDQKQD